MLFRFLTLEDYTSVYMSQIDLFLSTKIDVQFTNQLPMDEYDMLTVVLEERLRQIDQESKKKS
jgi:hypothetical protein